MQPFNRSTSGPGDKSWNTLDTGSKEDREEFDADKARALSLKALHRCMEWIGEDVGDRRDMQYKDHVTSFKRSIASVAGLGNQLLLSVKCSRVV